jgi:hypothetical protein
VSNRSEVATGSGVYLFDAVGGTVADNGLVSYSGIPLKTSNCSGVLFSGNTESADPGDCPALTNRVPEIQSMDPVGPDWRRWNAAFSVASLDADAGPSPLRYTWCRPTGPGPVTFSPNGETNADTTTVTFTIPGDYTIQVEVDDGVNLAVTQRFFQVSRPWGTLFKWY